MGIWASLKSFGEIHVPFGRQGEYIIGMSANNFYAFVCYKIGLDGLRQAALVHIESQLTPENIVSELFSDFTWR